MTTKIVVAMPDSQRYARRLSDEFPDRTFVAVDDMSAAKPHFDDLEVLVCGSTVTDRMVDQMPHLKWVQSYLSGIDAIARALSQRPDVLLTSARGLHGPQMAEMALFHMLALSRGVPTLVRNQTAHRWEKMTPRVLDQKVVGVVGLGVIGMAIARVCAALGMTVYGFARAERPVEGVDRVFRSSLLVEVAPELDFLVLVVPYSRETEKLVDDAVISSLRSSAILINLARGGLVDEVALVEALRERRIAGAGLDVFSEEPLPAQSPLWDLDNVLITPHIGGRSDRYYEQLLPLLVHNFRSYFTDAHEQLVNVVA